MKEEELIDDLYIMIARAIRDWGEKHDSSKKYASEFLPTILTSLEYIVSRNLSYISPDKEHYDLSCDLFREHLSDMYVLMKKKESDER